MNGLQLKFDLTLIFFSNTKLDPDAPSRADPSIREGLHRLVTNIPGCDIEKGDQFAEYVGSGAPKETGMFFARVIIVVSMFFWERKNKIQNKVAVNVRLSL